VNKIKVSICVPTRNRANFLVRALRSLTDQTFNKKNYEIIVVDDCSNDQTNIILKGFKGEIIVIKNKTHKGLSFSLNRAIKKARGNYFLRVDSDDYVNKEYVNLLFESISRNPEYSAACCDYYMVDDNEKVLKKYNAEKHPIGCGIIFKIKELKKIGMYSTKIKINEEADLIKRFKMNKKFKILRIPIPLYRYKRHSTNMTNKK